MRDDTAKPEDFLPLTHLSYHMLLVLAGARLHGYGIIKEIERRTDGRMKPETGTLYTAIRRLREDGLLETVPAEESGEGGRRGDTYALSPLGRAVLEAESQRLARLVNIAREKRVIGGEAAESPR